MKKIRLWKIWLSLLFYDISVYTAKNKWSDLRSKSKAIYKTITKLTYKE